MTIKSLHKSLLTACWLTELITNGPDVFPKHVIDCMMVITAITDRWPNEFRAMVISELAEKAENV